VGLRVFLAEEISLNKEILGQDDPGYKLIQVIQNL
jgi:hypothetical protein